MPETRTPFNDAHLVQLVRVRLGRANLSSIEKVNVSSCKFVVTLHGIVPSYEVRNCVGDAVGEVSGVRGVISGVRGVINKLRVPEDLGTPVFPPAGFGVSDLVEYPEVPE